MRTATDYLESLRNRDLKLWVDGERVSDPTAHPKVRPSINAVAATYELAHDPQYAELATAYSELTNTRVNRFTHLFREPADLVRKIELPRRAPSSPPDRPSPMAFCICLGRTPHVVRSPLLLQAT